MPIYLHLFLNRFTVASYLLVSAPSFVKTKQCDLKHFKNVSTGNLPLPPSDIISSHNVGIGVECYLYCHKAEKCVGYNYRESSLHSENCQLSNRTKKPNKSETGEWVYYQNINVKAIKGLLYSECFGYKWLTDRRNQKYPTGALCDLSLSTGWYRFGGEAGTKLATTCVASFRCGTDATGWMNGAHPSVADGKVTRQVCFHWDSICCKWSKNIEIINCGQYYVYKLGPTSHCQVGYCGSD